MIPVEKLRVGYILHVQGDSSISRKIRWLLGSWGSHDGMIVHFGGRWYVAEAQMKKGAVLTPLEDYLQFPAETLRVYRPADYDPLAAKQMQQIFMKRFKGRPYDNMGIFCLAIKYGLLKTITGRLLKRILPESTIDAWIDRLADWEWADWCTEMCHHLYLSVFCDYWRKDHPTPLTTEKRAADGTFILVE